MTALRKYTFWLALLMVLIVAGAQVYLLFDITNLPVGVTIKDALVSTILVSLSIWSIVLLIDAYPTRVAIEQYAIVIGIIISGACVLADWQTLYWWTGSHVAGYREWLQQTLPIRIIIFGLILLWTATYYALHKKTESLEKKFKKQVDSTSLLREAELFKLRQQLQPHFLYNSLNSISALVMIEPDKAQEMIGKLSDFLRNSVRREAEDEILIDDELRYIEAYLAIEAIRFGDRLKVKFEKEYTDDAKVPPFLLQPILENAIKYGLYGKTGAVTITMHIALQSPFLVITVTNPYDPQTLPQKGTGFGLQGIQRRLYLLYARTDLLKTNKDNEYFTTTLKIPQQHVQSDTD